MRDKEAEKAYQDARDTLVTVISLIVIVVQSIIIIFGFVYRWDWIVYECAAMLIIPAVIVLYFGVQAIIHANTLMNAEVEARKNEGN